MTAYISGWLAAVNEESGTATFTATLSEALATTASINYVVQTGTATVLDFTSASGTLTFAPGQTSRSFTFSIADESLSEGVESFFVNLTGAVGATPPVPRVIGLIGASDNAGGGLSTVSVEPLTVDRNAGMAHVRVFRDMASGVVSLNYATTSITALAGLDFDAVSGGLSFAANETEKTIDVPIVRDAGPEATEWFGVNLSNIAGAMPGRTSALVTIAGQAPPQASMPGIFARPLYLNETQPAGYLGLNLSWPSATEVSVSVSLLTSASLTANSSDFVSASSARLTFPPGTTYLEYPIGVRPDALTEGFESCMAQLSSPSGAVVETPVVPVNFTGEMAFSGGVFVSVADVTGAESGDTATVWATLNQPHSQPVTVTYTTVAGTADDTDITPTTGQLIFAPYQTRAPIPVHLIQDGLNESVETFGLRLSNPVNAALGDSFAQYTIYDDDAARGAAPSFADPHALFDPVTGEWHIVLRQNAPAAQSTSVQFNVIPSGPAQNQLFGGVFSLGIPAGSVVNTLTLPVNADAAAEQAKGVVLRFGGGAGPMSVGVMPGHGGFLPSDGNRGVLRSGDVMVDESDDEMTITFSYDGPPLTEVIRPMVKLASGWDMLSGDLQLLDGSTELAFGPGMPNVATLTIPIVQDDVAEGTEMFFWTLDGLPSGIDGPGICSGTILDNDVELPGGPRLYVLDGVYDPTRGELAVPVLRSGDLSGTTTVQMHDMAAPGSENAAFWGQSALLTFSPGEVLAYYRLVLDVLLVATGYRAIQLYLDSVTNGEAERNNTVAMIAPQGGATDAPPAVILSGMLRDGNSLSIGNNWLPARFSVSLDHASTKPVTVEYTLPANEFTGHDLSALFFGASAGRVTFLPGETIKTIDVTALFRTGETSTSDIVLTLTSATNATLYNREAHVLADLPRTPPLAPRGGGLASTLAHPLAASETAATGDVVVEVDSAIVDEASGYVDVVFRLSAPRTVPVTVSYSTSAANTSGATDFAPVSNGTLQFAAGETLKTVRFAINDDAANEGAESFQIRVTAGANLLAGDPVATVVIPASDRGDTGLPLLSVLSTTVNQSDPWARVVVALDRTSSQPVTFDYRSVDGNARSGSDYRAVSGSSGFMPGQTVTTIFVPLLDDLTVERWESFFVDVSRVQGAAVALQRGVVAINNDDILGSEQLSVFGGSFHEDDGYADVPVLLGYPSHEVVSVSYTLTPGSASTADFASGFGGTLVFAPGETVKTLRIGLVDDALAEPTETFTLALSNAVGAVISVAQASINILDIDGGPTVTLSDDTAGTSSGADVSVTITFSEAVTGLSTDVLQGDFAVSNGTLKSLSGSGAVYTAVVTPAAGVQENLTLAVLRGAAQSATGRGNHGGGAEQPVDTRGPVLASATPAADATGVARDANIVITLNEPATPGSGAIVLKTAAGAVVQSFDVTQQGQGLTLAGNGLTLTLDPTALLAYGTSYVVEFQAGALRDALNNASPFANSYRFTTVANRPPVAANASVNTTEDQLLDGTLPAGSDPDGHSVSYAAGAAPAKGSVVVNANGTFRYTPSLNANGSDSFGFSISDGFGGSANYTVSVAIAAVNDAPVGANGSATLDEDTVLEGRLPAVTDPDGDTITYSLISGPALGTVVVQPDGRFRYTPAANANGADLFSFGVTDGVAVDAFAMALTVRNVNDAPSGGITLTGTPRVLERLGFSSTLSDVDRLGALSYQWLRDGSAIAGATQSSYELRAEDIGTAISLRVRYNDGGGTNETVLSAPTAAIAGLPTVPGASGGADTIAGTSGNDAIEGGAGDDTIEGREGRDSILGGPGNDILDGGSGDDTIDGNEGYDFVRLTGSEPLSLIFSGNGRATAVRGGETDQLINVEAAAGGSGADLLRGFDQLPHERGETLRGAAGNDTLEGAGGVDSAEYTGARSGYQVSRNASSGTITVSDTDPSNGSEGSDTLIGIERVVFADQMLAFGTRAEEIARLAFVLWTKDIVTSGALFSRGYSFYDVGYDFVTVSQVALQFWTADSDTQLAQRLITNSGSTKTVAQLLATMAAAGGEIPGRATALREIALDPATTALIQASGIRDNGVVAENVVPGFGQLFGLFPG